MSHSIIQNDNSDTIMHDANELPGSSQRKHVKMGIRKHLGLRVCALLTLLVQMKMSLCRAVDHGDNESAYSDARYVAFSVNSKGEKMDIYYSISTHQATTK